MKLFKSLFKFNYNYNFISCRMLSNMENLPGPLKKIFDRVNNKKAEYIKDLKEVIAIESISAVASKRDEVVKMCNWVANRLKKAGAKVEMKDIGMEKLMNGKSIPLPPVVFATLGNDPKKVNLLVYAHLDVQPALKSDGWKTEPFVLTEIDGKLYGRGTSDDKGPLLGWLHTIETYNAIKEPLPVNIKFVFEGMEESSSLGLEPLLVSEKNKFLKDIDYVCVTDSRWMGLDKPCVTFGLRGMCYVCVEIECAKSDLHSGIFGGSVYEAMSDLIFVMNTLTDKNGKILVDGVMDDVAPLEDFEKEIYEKVDFSVEDFKKSVEAKRLLHNEDKVQLLMHRWRLPCLSLHGIEGAFSEPGQKTVIPGKVIGKFSLRLVPNQKPDKIFNNVTEHIKKQWKTRKSPNKIKLQMINGARPWVADPRHPHYKACIKATKYVYSVDPILNREGGSIPITLVFQEVTQKNVLVLPIGSGDDGAHAQNEKINIRNYIEGHKVIGAYIYEVGKLKKT